MRPNFDLTEVGNLNSGKIHDIWGSVCAMSPKTVQWKSWSFSAYSSLPPQFITILGFCQIHQERNLLIRGLKTSRIKSSLDGHFSWIQPTRKMKTNKTDNLKKTQTQQKTNQSRDSERGRAFKTPATCLGQAMPELLDFQLCEQVNSFISISQMELFSIICSQKSNCQEKQ